MEQLVTPVAVQKRLGQRIWTVCEKAWWGFLVVGLNSSLGFTSTEGTPQNPMQEKVLALLASDAAEFVKGDGLGGSGLRCKFPEVPWSKRMGDLSLSYVGEIIEKARWLTWEQVEPGLPPVGRGGSLDACCFCDSWVAKHLLNPQLTRLSDDEVGPTLPHAVVRCTQKHWDVICRELVSRGVACIIPQKDIATFRGAPILNGAFGVLKPGKWIGKPEDGKPVLRLIMDFRAANSVHRELPGAVGTLVGPAKWQGFVLGDGEVLVSSGDDLVSSFYLFKVPYAWSCYFAFRKKVSRKALQVSGDPEELVYIASRVLPMGWSAAVTVMQHIHRQMTMVSKGLPPAREIRRDLPLPSREAMGASAFWNLYIDDLTVMEMVQDHCLAGGCTKSALQDAMRQVYRDREVPISQEKSSTRVMVSEKLGALVDGDRGTLSVTTKKQLEFLSLTLFLMGQRRFPTKWTQILLGKFVHMMQFRRQVFSNIRYTWDRLKFHAAEPMRASEVAEWLRILMLLPLLKVNLRARISGTATASDASESGGGLCASIQLTRLGQKGAKNPKKVVKRSDFIVVEWFAGIGGLGRALERLGLNPLHSVVCEQDEHCLAVLRSFLPGCTVFKDIRKVNRKDLREIFNRYPNARGVVQAGGSPCQGLSLLSANRMHFADARSGLFYELVRVMRLVKEEAAVRGWWHRGFVENVVCDLSDQEVFRLETGWPQFLACSSLLSVVRRPRVFWVSDEPVVESGTAVELGPGHKVIHYVGPKEPSELWTCPDWTWVGADTGVSLPTFTRSIPRAKPPYKPAGLAQCSAETRQRWIEDSHRFPPYTYQPKFCLTDGKYLRVAAPPEREILMGFLPGHTAKKVRVWNRDANQDERASSVGNSFHTGVVACLLRDCLKQFYPEVRSKTNVVLAAELAAEVRECQKEIFTWEREKPVFEPVEEWFVRLEDMELNIPRAPQVELGQQALLTQKMMDLLSYRGTDIHMDTLSFYRPDRLPTSSIDARQWDWRIIKGWKWRFPQHINVLEMEALYQSMRWRSRSLQNYDARFLHLTDSQVVLGIVAKGRTTSSRLRQSLHRYNMLILAMHSQPLLGWVTSAQNPADEPSRWFVQQ